MSDTQTIDLTTMLSQLTAKREVLQAKRADIDKSLDEVERAIQGIEIGIRLTKTAVPTMGSDRGGLIGAIREVFLASAGPLTVHDVHDFAAKKLPTVEIKLASVSSALARMAERGELKIVQRGGGQRAALYIRSDLDIPMPVSDQDQEKKPDAQ